MRQRRSTFDAILCAGHVTFQFTQASLVNPRLQHLQAARNAREEIIEIVRQAAR